MSNHTSANECRHAPKRTIECRREGGCIERVASMPRHAIRILNLTKVQEQLFLDGCEDLRQEEISEKEKTYGCKRKINVNGEKANDNQRKSTDLHLRTGLESRVGY